MVGMVWNTLYVIKYESEFRWWFGGAVDVSSLEKKKLVGIGDRTHWSLNRKTSSFHSLHKKGKEIEVVFFFVIIVGKILLLGLENIHSINFQLELSSGLSALVLVTIFISSLSGHSFNLRLGSVSVLYGPLLILVSTSSRPIKELPNGNDCKEPSTRLDSLARTKNIRMFAKESCKITNKQVRGRKLKSSKGSGR